MRRGALAAITFLLTVAVLIGCHGVWGEVEKEHVVRARLENNGHLADYALLARLEYPSYDAAMKYKEAITGGRLGLDQAMDGQAQAAAAKKQAASGQGRGSTARERKFAEEEGDGGGGGGGEGGPDQGEFSADGLMTIDDMEPQLAELVLDIRNDAATPDSPNLVGPVQTSDSTWVMALVFMRYRRSFFSQDWWELDAFAKAEGIPFKQLIRDFSNEDVVRYLSSSVWPHDDIAVRRLKIRAIQQDIKRIGSVRDPSVEFQAPNDEPPREDVDEMIRERREFFEQVPPWVKQQHPEVYSMDIVDIVERGWGPDAAPPEGSEFEIEDVEDGQPIEVRVDEEAIENAVRREEL